MEPLVAVEALVVEPLVAVEALVVEALVAGVEAEAKAELEG